MTDIVIGGDSVDIPNGVYQGKVVSVETRESTMYGEFRAWDFELDNGSHVGGNTSMSTHPKSKGGKWIAALIGRQPEQGEKVTLTGRSGTLNVGTNTNGWPTVLDVLPPATASTVVPLADDVQAEDLPF